MRWSQFRPRLAGAGVLIRIIIFAEKDTHGRLPLFLRLFTLFHPIDWDVQLNDDAVMHQPIDGRSRRGKDSDG
jgi:hypothetical protein